MSDRVVLPTPQQMAGMAKEYAMAQAYAKVRPSAAPPAPDKLQCEQCGRLCDHLRLIRDCLTHLGALPPTVQQLADHAMHSVSVTHRLLCDYAGDCDKAGTNPLPDAKNYTQRLQQALLYSCDFCDALYSGDFPLARRMPLVAQQAHYTHSLLLTLTAF